MATIDAALNGGSTIATGGHTEIPREEGTSVAAPHVAPGVETPTPITNSTEGSAPTPEGSGADDRDESFNGASNTGGSNGFQDTLNAAKGIVRGGGVALESIPTPGSIMFPLVILLVFFFLLVPVNGHTRMTWLWLSITGNASIGPDTGAAAVTNPTVDLSSSMASLATSAATIDATASTFSAGIIAYVPGE